MRKQTFFVKPSNFDTADFKCFSVINLYLRSSLLAKTYMQFKFNDPNTDCSLTITKKRLFKYFTTKKWKFSGKKF